MVAALLLAFATASCDGQIVSSVAIHAERPPFSGASRKWQIVARALGLHHATTREGVVRAYLLVKPGSVCTDQRLTESEHVLRGLPFLSGARVTARPDSSGGVVVDVQTTDEIPVLIAGSLRGGVPAALALGNENVGGAGLRLLAGGARGGAYRGAARVEAIGYAPFGLPVTAQARLERAPLGESGTIDLARPFLSDLQRGAWQLGFSDGHEFPIILRPEGDNEAVELRRRRWSGSGLVRTQLAGTRALLGPVAFGMSVAPANRLLLVTDTGAVDIADSLVSTRLFAQHTTWVGGLVGLRRVGYVTRAGLDALFGEQDMLNGWQAGVVGAPGLGAKHDALLATSAIAGFANQRLALSADFEAEAHRGVLEGGRSSDVSNLNLAAYITPSSRVTLTIRDNLSRANNAWIPAQLSLGDPIGGPRGYLGSRIAGGVRNLTRAELRAATPSAIRGADLGMALFFDAAEMRAGDVPYGVNTSARSVGFSLLGAYPSGSKRTYRIDIAFPLRRMGGRGIEIRFGRGDPTNVNSLEPFDVTQLRSAPIPSTIFGWAR